MAMKPAMAIAATLLLHPVLQAQTIVPGTETNITSPDQRLQLRLYQKSQPDGRRQLFYQLSYRGRAVMRESLLDVQLDNHLSEQAMALPVDRRINWFDNLAVTVIRTASHDSQWKPGYGERARIRDHYNTVTVDLVKDDNPIYPMSLEVRAYNEGVALGSVALAEPSLGSCKLRRQTLWTACHA